MASPCISPAKNCMKNSKNLLKLDISILVSGGRRAENHLKQHTPPMPFLPLASVWTLTDGSDRVRRQIPFHGAQNICHQCMSALTPLETHSFWKGEQNFMEKLIIRCKKEQEHGMTCDTNWRKPASSCVSHKLANHLVDQLQRSNWRNSSLSSSKCASMATESSSSPKNSILVVGQTVFESWNTRPSSYPRPIIHSTAAEHTGAWEAGEKTRKKSSR